MNFDPRLAIHWSDHNASFEYSPDTFCPQQNSAATTSDKACSIHPAMAQTTLYSIGMDIGREGHSPELHRLMHLFGVVRYASGHLGREPIRSQGHVNAVSAHSDWCAPDDLSQSKNLPKIRHLAIPSNLRAIHPLPESLQWISDPARHADLWSSFVP
jgi:hypothetical protein